MSTPPSGNENNDRTKTPVQSSPTQDYSGRNARDRADDDAPGLDRDLATFHIGQSSENVDTPRSASPAPTYRTVETQIGGRTASPAPSYATIDPMFGHPDEPSTLLSNPNPERILDGQRQIEELIRQNVIAENMRYALEHHPECVSLPFL